MNSVRWGAPLCAIVALLAVLAWPASAAGDPIDSLTLTGVVRDAAGNLLEDVQVLVLGERPASSPLAKVLTGEDGRYSIAGLVPGAYRVAAVKPGYRTFFGRVDTLVNATLDVLLSSGADAIRDPERADSADWVLRVPTRSILRELDGADVVAPAADPGGQAQATARDLLSVQLDQWFVMGESHTSTAVLADTRGTQTSASIGGPIGESAMVRLEGSRSSLDEAVRSLDAETPSLRQTSLSLDLSYAAGPDADLDLRAFYGRSDFESLDGKPDASSDSLHRAWGYDAAWSLQIDPMSRVSVKLDYDDVALRAGDALPSHKPVGDEGFADLTNRRMGAVGTYESVLIDGHQVKFDVRAQFVEAQARPAASPLGSTARVRGLLDDGWTFRVDAEDSWSWGQPLTVISGLGYRHSLAGDGFSLLAPRIGALWSTDWISLEVLLSYAETWFDRWTPADRELGDEGPPVAGGVGYLASVRLPITRSLVLTGESGYAPVAVDGAAYPLEDPEPGETPLYLSDGNASSQHVSVGITHDRLKTQTSLRFSEGTAEGLLAPVPQLALPVQLLGYGSLRFRDGSLAVRVNPSGTRVVLEYRVVGQPTVFEEESLELRVVQDLLEALQGSWRLLLAARVASADVEDAADARSTSFGYPYTPRGRQVSAGLSVTF